MGRSGAGTELTSEQDFWGGCTTSQRLQTVGAQGKSSVDIFLHIFPVQFVETVMVEVTSRMLMSDNLVQTTMGDAPVHWDVAAHELLHEAPRILLETSNKDSNGCGG